MPVLRDETISTYGFDPATLKPKSNRIVVNRCDECSVIFHQKFVIVNKPSVRCTPCVRKGVNKGGDPEVWAARIAKRHATMLAKYGKRGFVSEENKAKRRATCIERYGGPSPFSSDAVKAKSEATLLERYGVPTPFLSEEIREKGRQTSQERYGASQYNLSDEGRARVTASQRARSREQVDATLARRQETLKARYGVNSALQVPGALEKRRATVLQRYGAFRRMTEAEKSRRRETCIARYGGPSPMCDPVIAAKAQARKVATAVERYGTSHPMQVRAVAAQAQRTRRKTLQKRYGVSAPLQCPRFRAKAQRTKILRYGTLTPRNLGKTEEELRRQVEAWSGAAAPSFVLQDGKSLDIYAPGQQIALEYCGLYWHNEMSPEPRGRSYHWEKCHQAAVEGIRLITIFEDEWLHRRPQVEGFLQHTFGVHERRVGARSCSVREVGREEAAVFLEQHHIQGAGAFALVAYGIFAAEEMVGVITLSRHHRQGHADAVVLNRLCFAAGVSVPGGAARLLKRAKSWAQAEGFLRMISWSDNRWSAGSVYRALGFQLRTELGPDYSYVVKGKSGVRVSKQSQRKGVTGCPPEVTEREWALQRGLYRIWDCGKKRWELSL